MSDSTTSIVRNGHDVVDRASRNSIDSDLLTVAETAAMLKLPVSWVYEHARRRGVERIPHFKLGKYLRFSEREVLEWLERVRV